MSFRQERINPQRILRQISSWIGRILANHKYGLSWCDIVPGRPIFLTRDRIEVLFDNLLSSR